MEPYLASIPEAQRALGIARSTAYRLMDAGKLERAEKLGIGATCPLCGFSELTPSLIIFFKTH